MTAIAYPSSDCAIKTVLYTFKLMASRRMLFLLYLEDGYTFKNTMAILKAVSDTATMILTTDSIEISVSNNEKNGIHFVKLQTGDFTKYVYNFIGENGELIPRRPISFDTKKLSNSMKSIGKKDGLRIYLTEGDNKLLVQPVKVSSDEHNNSSAIFVDIINAEFVQITPPDIENRKPNVKVPSKSFTDMYSIVNTNNGSYIEIIGKEKSVTFIGKTSSNNLLYHRSFNSQIVIGGANNINEDFLVSQLKKLDMTETANQPVTEDVNNRVQLSVISPDDIVTVISPMQTLKPLSKIYNISGPNTQLKFYFTRNSSVMIESPIGNYGKYAIVIVNRQKS